MQQGALTEQPGKAHDPIMQQLQKLGIRPTQEDYLALAYPEQELDAELEANLPDHFFDLPLE